MKKNNTSAFNYRPIEGTSTLSLHSYGAAIDVNPVQNPFVGNHGVNREKDCGFTEVWPVEGLSYLNRAHPEPGMVEPVVGIFYKHGFRDWGGYWKDPIDYHHFQLPRSLAEFLAEMSSEHAVLFFRWYVENPEVNFSEKLRITYKNNPAQFMRELNFAS